MSIFIHLNNMGLAKKTSKHKTFYLKFRNYENTKIFIPVYYDLKPKISTVLVFRTDVKNFVNIKIGIVRRIYRDTLGHRFYVEEIKKYADSDEKETKYYTIFTDNCVCELVPINTKEQYE